MKTKSLLTTLAVLAIGATAYAAPITITFQENGSNLSLGSSSTFTVSGSSLTAYASSGQTLYAKSAGAGETGLGITSDIDHEINPSNFIQVYSSLSGFRVESLYLSSVQTSEAATIYFSSILGTLGSLIGTVTADGSFDVSAYGTGYFGVSASAGNVLFASATGSSRVPDAGSTVLLLGSALTGLGLLKRKLVA